MRKIVLLAFAGAISCYSFSQGATQRFEQVMSVLPSAPNATAITKFGGINVNLSKGMISHAYPLYELGIKGVTVPFSLNYTANGLKVDEYASRVGMNWSLDAGGVISRTVYGNPDESSQRLEMPAVGPVIDTAYYNFLVKATGGGNFDPQPDVFSYSFCGISGKFVLDKNKVPVTLDGSPIRIETDFNSSDWNIKVTGLDGTQYFLGAVPLPKKPGLKTPAASRTIFMFPPPGILRKSSTFMAGKSLLIMLQLNSIFRLDIPSPNTLMERLTSNAPIHQVLPLVASRRHLYYAYHILHRILHAQG